MHRLQNMTARRAFLLAGIAALTLLIAGGGVLLNEGEQPAAEGNLTERKSILKPRKKPVAPLPFENGKLVLDGYKWRDPHPWLVSVRGDIYRRYIGPQTAEAIFAVFDSPYTTGEKAEKLLAHWERVLARGAVVNDYRDALEYGHNLMNRLHRMNANPSSPYRDRFDLSTDASLEELEEVEETWIADVIRSWPIRKEQHNHAAKTGEGTLNVTLFWNRYGGGGGMGISTVRAGGSRGSGDLTEKERRNIRYYGIAPKGFRLRLEDENDNELPLDKYPSFNERDAVKRLNKSNLQQLLFALPSYLSQPDAQERSSAAWMQIVERYDASLAALADRGQVPEAAAPLASPPQPAASMAGRGDSEQRRRRVAEAYVSALEKQAQKARISEAARSQISRRIQELRALMTGPAGAPVEPPPSQDGGNDEDE